MGLKKTIVVLLVLLTSGCAGPRGTAGRVIDEDKVRTFADIYRKAKAMSSLEASSPLTASLAPDIGYEAPYFPVHVPGRVARVWVPAHVADGDRDVLVAGHWAFVMIERPHWYVEGRETADAPP